MGQEVDLASMDLELPDGISQVHGLINSVDCRYGDGRIFLHPARILYIWQRTVHWKGSSFGGKSFCDRLIGHKLYWTVRDGWPCRQDEPGTPYRRAM